MIDKDFLLWFWGAPVGLENTKQEAYGISKFPLYMKRTENEWERIIKQMQWEEFDDVIWCVWKNVKYLTKILLNIDTADLSLLPVSAFFLKVD